MSTTAPLNWMPIPAATAWGPATTRWQTTALLVRVTAHTEEH